ncbi:hypothetical protein KP509_17G077600 [Ceratopteris richardii]|nr:hypothetical protein KP509_17G077600 [Ceratopteris richardii]
MRGYKFWETVTVAPGKLENYEAKLAQFFTEHLHPYDESRLILEGSGYWDIRGINGDWIRFHVEKGDLIVLPPGMYHRFTLDKQNYIKALLLYTEVPTRVDVMSPEGDKLEVRKDYVNKFLNKLGCPGPTLSSASSNITEESFSSRSSDLGYDSEITAKLPALSLQDDSALAIPTVG